MLTRAHYFDIPLAIVCCVGVVLFTVLLALLTRRRHLLVIRERSFALLLISAVGNLLVLICVSVDGIFGDEFDEYEWLVFYLNIACEYLFIAPYILRIYNLKITYMDLTNSDDSTTIQSRRLTVRWYSAALFFGFFPFMIIPVLVGIWHLVMPSCTDYCVMGYWPYRLMFIAWNFVDFLEAMLLLLGLYILRCLSPSNVDEYFKIYSEMRIVCVVTVLTSLANLYSANEVVYFVQAARSLVILFVSNFLPAVRSLDDSYEVWLTPEVISNFTLTLQHEDSLRAFRNFLHQTPISGFSMRVSQPRPTGSLLCAETYLLLYLATLSVERNMQLETVLAIKKEYYDPISQMFPKDLQHSVDDQLRDLGADTKDLSSVFAAVRNFAGNVLQEYYFPAYLESRPFASLDAKVKLFLRIKNRDREIFEEVIN